MREEILHKIDILPARFIKKIENDKSIVDVLIGGNYVERRVFDKYALDGIENPNYLFIGIMTGVGFMRITFCDANDYEKLFKKKFKVLLK